MYFPVYFLGNADSQDWGYASVFRTSLPIPSLHYLFRSTAFPRPSVRELTWDGVNISLPLSGAFDWRHFGARVNDLSACVSCASLLMLVRVWGFRWRAQCNWPPAHDDTSLGRVNGPRSCWFVQAAKFPLRLNRAVCWPTSVPQTNAHLVRTREGGVNLPLVFWRIRWATKPWSFQVIQGRLVSNSL